MRWVSLGILVALTGCYRWAPATSLYEVQNDEVTVHTEDSSLLLQHASTNGRMLSGMTAEGEQAEIDLTHARVQVRRLNVAATAGLVASLGVLTAAAVVVPVLMIVLTASHPIPDSGGGTGGFR